jgi:hypothetical protein
MSCGTLEECYFICDWYFLLAFMFPRSLCKEHLLVVSRSSKASSLVGGVKLNWP